MNHTPGPWRQFTSPENSWIGNAETGEIVADRPNVSTPLINARRWNNNAEFITRACNAHEELLEALKALIEADHNIQENKGLKSDQAMYRIAALDMAERAIAKAERKG